MWKLNKKRYEKYKNNLSLTFPFEIEVNIISKYLLSINKVNIFLNIYYTCDFCLLVILILNISIKKKWKNIQC